MKNLLFFCILFFTVTGLAQNTPQISTKEIDNFWEAYDQLSNCQTQEDSINTFQVNYIDKASEGFKAFLDVRNFTAIEYYKLTKNAPKFWNSVRANTLKVKTIIGDIEKIYNDYEKAYPNHTKPNICFAIGGLRTAGTVASGYLLIGTEMISADLATDKTELNNWLKTVLTTEFDVTGIIAHEYVHALQKTKFGQIWGALNYKVLTNCLNEGAADFLAEKVTGNTINKHIYTYGNNHEAEIWTNFKKDMYGNKTSNWLYQGTKAAKGVPADLGYFVGYKICESYYEKAPDKSQALKDILWIKNYKRFYKKAGIKKIKSQSSSIFLV